MTFKLFNRTLYIKKEIVAVCIILLFVVFGIIRVAIKNHGGEIIIESPRQSAEETGGRLTDSTRQEKQTEKEQDKIQIYVVGCVHSPGIVTLNKGQIIADAIAAAGGATEEADLKNINLVYKLWENVKIEVQSKKAPLAGPDTSVQSTSEWGSGIRITAGSDGAVYYESSANSHPLRKVNINTAALDELTTLTGIGEATAREIIIYRETAGPFKKIEEIMKVPGIKESRFKSIQDRITVK